MSMEKFVNSKCSACFYYIKSIRRIRKFLTMDATKTLIHAYVISRLDYANSLLFGINKKLITKLQKVQNAAARVIYGCSKTNDSAELLKELHWLPVAKRIVFKMLHFVYIALHGLGPAYLKELLPDYHHNECYSLRSNSNLQLEGTRTSNSFGDRCFQVAGPRLWNLLPLYIRNAQSIGVFKKVLKTYLFNNDVIF